MYAHSASYLPHLVSMSLLWLASGCVSSHYETAKVTQDLAEIELFLREYQGSQDPQIKRYVDDLLQEKDKLLWRNATYEKSLDSINAYLNSPHKPKASLEEARELYDKLLFERALTEAEAGSLEALTSFEASCQRCGEAHKNYLQRSICKTQLARSAEELAMLAPQDGAREMIAGACLTFPNASITLDARALMALWASSDVSLLEQSAKLHDERCALPERWRPLLREGIKQAATSIAQSSQRYLELRDRLAVSFKGELAQRCSPPELPAELLKAQVASMLPSFEATLKLNRRRQERVSLEDVLAPKFTPSAHCQALDAHALQLCEDAQEGGWMSPYLPVFEVVKRPCKELTQQQKRCVKRVSAQSKRLLDKHERGVLSALRAALRERPCASLYAEPSELSSAKRCAPFSIASMKRACSREVSKALTRCPHPPQPPQTQPPQAQPPQTQPPQAQPPQAQPPQAQPPQAQPPQAQPPQTQPK